MAAHTLSPKSVKLQLTPDKAPIAFLRVISPDYLRTTGIPFLRGRSFAASDTADTPRVAIINETMVTGTGPIRTRSASTSSIHASAWLWKLIGVAGDVKFAGLGVAGRSRKCMSISPASRFHHVRRCSDIGRPRQTCDGRAKRSIRHRSGTAGGRLS